MKNWRSRKIENASPKKFGMMSGLSVPMNWMPASRSWKVRAQTHVERHRGHLDGQHQRREHEQEDDVAARATACARRRRRPGRTRRRRRPSRGRRTGTCSTCSGARSICLNTVQKFFHTMGCGMSRDDSACWSVISAVRIMKMIGTMKMSDTPISTEWLATVSEEAPATHARGHRTAACRRGGLGGRCRRRWLLACLPSVVHPAP